MLVLVTKIAYITCPPFLLSLAWSSHPAVDEAGLARHQGLDCLPQQYEGYGHTQIGDASSRDLLKQIARFREYEVAKREEDYGSEGPASASEGGGDCPYISRAG